MISNFMDHAWKTIPVLTAIACIMYFTIWTTIKVNNFVHDVNDMNTKQLPAIREQLTGLDTRLTSVENRLTAVETRLIVVEKTLVEIQVTLKDIQKEVHSQKRP